MNSKDLRRRAEDAIHSYFESRRPMVRLFAQKNLHSKTLLTENKTLWAKDLSRHVINSFIVLPYIFLKRTAIWLDQLGWDHGLRLIKKIRPGFRTKIEEELEWLLGTEFLEIPMTLGSRVSSKDELRYYFEKDHINLAENEWAKMIERLQRHLREKLKDWLEQRAYWQELTSSTVVWLTGFVFFGDSKLEVFAIGKHLAKWWSVRVGLFLDPLHRRVHLHERNLCKLLDSLEVELLLTAKR